MSGVQIWTVETPRFQMDVSVFGQGERAFVIFPGISVEPVSRSAVAVAASYRAFGKDYTVYVFDRVRDFGEGYTVQAMARDTAEAMARLGIRGADALGTSQGGMILQCLAREHPELIRRGVLGSTAARMEPKGTALMRSWKELALAGDTQGLNRAM